MKFLLPFLPYILGLLLVASVAMGAYVWSLKSTNATLVQTTVALSAESQSLKDYTKVLEKRVFDARMDALAAQELAEARAQSAQKIRTITKEITREIPAVLKPSQADPGNWPVLLPHGWGLLHDAAASGRPELLRAASTSGADGPPIPIEAAAEAVVDNYGTCRDNADQLEKLQDHVCNVAPDSASYCSQR